MAQIIDDPYRSLSGSLGAQMGTGLGAGIGGALQNLAQWKVNELMQKRNMLGLQGLLAPEDQSKAQYIAALPPEMQQMVFKDILQKPQEEAYAQYLGQITGGGTPGLTGAQGAPRLSAQQATKLAELSLHQKEFAEKQAEARTKREEATQLKKQAFINKQIEPYIKQTVSNGVTYKNMFAPIKALKQAILSGKTVTGKPGALLEKFGLEKFIENDETRMMMASAEDLASLAANVKGERPTKFRLEMELRKKPLISQSRETQIKRAERYEDEAVEGFRRSKILDRLSAEFAGENPADIASKVEKEYNKENREIKKRLNAEIGGISKADPEAIYLDPDTETYWEVKDGEWREVIGE